MTTTFLNLPDNTGWQVQFSGAQMIPLGGFIQAALRKPFVLARVSRHTDFVRTVSDEKAVLVPNLESSIARIHPPIRRWSNPALMTIRMSFDGTTRQLFMSEAIQSEDEYMPMAHNESGKRAVIGLLTIRYRIASDDQDSYAEMLTFW